MTDTIQDSQLLARLAHYHRTRHNTSMNRWGIRHQLFLLAFLPTLTIFLLVGAYLTHTHHQDLKQYFCNRSQAIALGFASANKEGIVTKKNKASLQQLAEATVKEQKVNYLSFYSPEGLEVVASGQPLLFPFEVPSNTNISIQEEASSFSVTVPVTTYQEEDLSKTEVLIGWLRLGFDNTLILNRTYQVLINSGLIILLGLGITILYALQMGRKITHPLMELTQAIKRIRGGDFKTRLRPSRYPELQGLESSVNNMAETLQNRDVERQSKINQTTARLKRSLETIELQNLELETSRQAVETASQIKSEFLVDMSDEIRAPLNSMADLINLLEKTDLDGIQKHYLDILKKSSKTLMSILNDVLDFSTIEVGELRIEPILINIRECVEETLNLLAPYANEKSLSLIPLIYSDIPTEALADPLRIKQIITNLVNNAIKFTEKGSVMVRVMLEKRYQDHALIRVSVTDTGIGLSQFEQQELFQAFNQMKTGTSHKLGDTGLGLIISKKLVEQMKGQMGLESQQGKGSTFWFTFEVELMKQVKNDHPTSQNPLSMQFSEDLLAIDWNLGIKLAGGKQDLARELIRKLIETLPEDQNNIQQAFLSRDWESLRDIVHRLHGACCYCGVPKLKQAAERLETVLVSCNLNVIQPQMEMLNESIEELLQERLPV